MMSLSNIAYTVIPLARSTVIIINLFLSNILLRFEEKHCVDDFFSFKDEMNKWTTISNGTP